MFATNVTTEITSPSQDIGSHLLSPSPSSTTKVKSTSSFGSAGLTPEMYIQLVNFLKNVQPTKSPTSSANFAGNFSTTSHYVTCLSTSAGNSVWIIDSGANDHTCFNEKLFTSLFTLPQTLHISLPNGSVIPITYSGTIFITRDIILNNVLFVPNFSYNLLSVNKLAQQLHCSVYFTNDTCNLQGYSLKKPLALGKA